MRLLKCTGATLLMLLATFFAFHASFEAGAREDWRAFRPDHLMRGSALLSAVGAPAFWLAGGLVARAKGSHPARDGVGIAMVALGAALGTWATVIANKDPGGLPFMALAALLFIGSTLVLSMRVDT